MLNFNKGIIQKFIQTRVKEAGAEGVVLGLSGGIDSATTLALAVSSIGSEKVKGLIMPFKESDFLVLHLFDSGKITPYLNRKITVYLRNGNVNYFKTL